MSKKKLIVNLDKNLCLWLKEKAERDYTTVTQLVTNIIETEKASDDLVPPPPVSEDRSLAGKKLVTLNLSAKSIELVAKHAVDNGISKTAVLEKILREEINGLGTIEPDTAGKKLSTFTLSQYARKVIDERRLYLGTRASKTELLERIIQLKLSDDIKVM